MLSLQQEMLHDLVQHVLLHGIPCVVARHFFCCFSGEQCKQHYPYSVKSLVTHWYK